MKTILFTFLFFILPVMADQDLKSTFSAYLVIQNQLAQDNLDQARKAASEMLSTVNQIDPMKLRSEEMQKWTLQEENIKAALSLAVEAGRIDELRFQFNLISNSMIALGLPETLTGIDQFHCSMAFGGKGADWLQNGTSTMNPYFGSRMLGCGQKVGQTKNAPMQSCGKMMSTKSKKSGCCSK